MLARLSPFNWFILFFISTLKPFNMLKTKRDIKQLDFYSLEVVDRVSETQLQVSENSNQKNWRLKD